MKNKEKCPRYQSKKHKILYKREIRYEVIII